MKDINIYISIITVLIFSSCNDCTKCVNNLAEYKSKIPYKNGDIVIFHNDTLGNRIDTIGLEYAPANTSENNCTGTKSASDQNNQMCSGVLNFYLKNVTLEVSIDQAPNFNKNKTSFFTKFDYVDYIGLNKIRDTISYIYNVETLKTIHNKWIEPFKSINPHLNITEYYYSISPKIRILQYTTIDTNGVTRTWKLQ
jgi:hypothetical protein